MMRLQASLAGNQHAAHHQLHHPAASAAAHRKQHRSRCWQVVAVSDAAQTSEVASAPSPSIEWGRSMAQGPRPSMEDEMRLEEDCKDGFTYAGARGVG